MCYKVLLVSGYIGNYLSVVNLFLMSRESLGLGIRRRSRSLERTGHALAFDVD